MDSCRHEMNPAWCAWCLGTEKPPDGGEPPRPTRPSRRPGRKAKRSPDITVAEAVASGELCGRCLTPLTAGCLCSRRELDGLRRSGAVEWLQLHAGELGGGEVASGRVATGLAFRVTARSSRRAGFDPDAVTEMREEVIDRFGVDPSWSPYRVTEANHLPV